MSLRGLTDYGSCSSRPAKINGVNF